VSYKQLRDIDGTITNSYIKRKSDNALIPADEANRDYQEYLEWVAKGNTPEPADEENA